MPKPDRKPDPDFEPEYNTADAEYDDAVQVDFEAGADVEYDEGADPDYDDTGQAAFEVEVVDPDYEDVPVMAVAENEAEPELAAPLPAASEFAFELGRPVLPLTQQQPHPVVWRGHLKERHPATGLVQRVPVYLLGDGHWDCYREEELQVA